MMNTPPPPPGAQVCGMLPHWLHLFFRRPRRPVGKGSRGVRARSGATLVASMERPMEKQSVRKTRHLTNEFLISFVVSEFVNHFPPVCRITRRR